MVKDQVTVQFWNKPQEIDPELKKVHVEVLRKQKSADLAEFLRPAFEALIKILIS